MMNENLPVDAEVWLAEHPDERRDELEKVWRLSEFADEPFEPDQQRVAEIRQNLTGRIASGPTSLRLIRSTEKLAIAASVALLVAIGATLWLRPIAVTAPRGGIATVVLPDQSTVQLNSGSSVEYRRTFGWMSRSVTLHGEAFFNVTKAESEFEVTTFNGTITVLGTRFNVRSWDDDNDPETVVFVEEGFVRVSARSSLKDAVVLQRGQWTTIRGASQPTEPEAISGRSQPAWQSGGMAFTNRPLSDILSEIERRFNIEVSVRPDSMLDASVSLYLASVRDAGTVLDMVAGVHDLHVVKTEDGFELVAK